jgi:hypothetical protein
MPRRMPERSNDVTVYMVLNDYRTGLAYVETASAPAQRWAPKSPRVIRAEQVQA